jgi:hypothetical protein
MPLMNGLESAREITRYSPGLPILMVSVHMSDQLANEAKKRSAYAVPAPRVTSDVSSKQWKPCCKTVLTTKIDGVGAKFLKSTV